METLHNIVFWLEGKKALFAALANVVIDFMVKQGDISQAVGTMLASLIAILVGGAVAVGASSGYKDYKMGKV